MTLWCRRLVIPSMVTEGDFALLLRVEAQRHLVFPRGHHDTEGLLQLVVREHAVGRAFGRRGVVARGDRRDARDLGDEVISGDEFRDRRGEAVPADVARVA